MTRVQSISKETAQKNVQDIYAAIEKKMGKVPNIFLNMGNSAAVLKGYLGMSEAAAQTSLSPKVRELIALVVGQANNCNYCLSAHTAIAQHEKIGDQEILLARKGESHDAKTQAILAFAKHVIEKKGHASEQEVAALKKAGVSDAELVEIILVISLNMFTNYFNHITDPKIDFPLAPNLN
jgi:uncharacterized peroxidase-related enzyme